MNANYNRSGMIRYSIYQAGKFLGFATEFSAPEAVTKYARLNKISTKGLTAARPVN